MGKFYNLNDMVEPDKHGAKIVPLSKAKIYRMVAVGEFPKPRKLGSRSVWLEEDIRVWREQFIEGTNG